MADIRVRADSRYLKTKVVFDGSDQYYDLWDEIEFKPRIDDTYHTILPGEEGRLDKIAFREYGNVRLWWVLATRNNVLDPAEDVKVQVGKQLAVPDYAYVLQVLSNAR